jgi:Predicted integral membrane protein
MSKASYGFTRKRIEALADGLFATVMTILVLSLVVPTITGPNAEATLEADLTGLLPDFFAYIITFIFLGVLWISHQNMLSHIEVVDLKVLWINILLLMSIALTPFSTALLGRYPLQPAAVFAYGFNALATSILFNILWFYPRIQRLTHEEPNPEAISKRSRIAVVGPTVYGFATAFSFVAPEVSLGLYVFVTVFYILFGGRYFH